MNMKNTALLFALSLSLFACAKQPVVPAAAATATTPAPATAQLASQVIAPSGDAKVVAELGDARVVPITGVATGVVLETLDAPGFTYIRMRTGDKETWAAVNRANVKIGSTVHIQGSMIAESFESTALGRKFEHMVFGTLADADKLPPKPKVRPVEDDDPHAGLELSSRSRKMLDATKNPLQPMKVEKARDGKTVAEVWAGRIKLDQKPVVVRGRVVKFIDGVMGRNWLHIQDGSGLPAVGNTDLVVTTMDSVKVGDIVTVTGRVRNDQDFGAGYSYQVLVEDAKVSK